MYRPCVGIILLNSESRIFIGQRCDAKENPEFSTSWQMPQGGIDAGETPQQAALRELFEEVGTTKAEIIAESKEWHHYDLPPNLQFKLWGGGYKGQKQKWFLMRFTGKDEEINLQTRHPEFSNYMWATPLEALDRVVPFKLEIYKSLFEEFANFLGKID